MDLDTHFLPLIVATLALVGCVWKLRKVRKIGERHEKLGWSLATIGLSVYFFYLLVRTTDLGPAEYVLGEVTSVGRTKRPPAARVELTRGMVEVPYVTVRAKGESLTVVGRYFEIGERVCVQRSLGRWSQSTYLEIVEKSKCVH